MRQSFLEAVFPCVVDADAAGRSPYLPPPPESDDADRFPPSPRSAAGDGSRGVSDAHTPRTPRSPREIQRRAEAQRRWLGEPASASLASFLREVGGGLGLSLSLASLQRQLAFFDCCQMRLAGLLFGVFEQLSLRTAAHMGGAALASVTAANAISVLTQVLASPSRFSLRTCMYVLCCVCTYAVCVSTYAVCTGTCGVTVWPCMVGADVKAASLSGGGPSHTGGGGGGPLLRSVSLGSLSSNGPETLFAFLFQQLPEVRVSQLFRRVAQMIAQPPSPTRGVHLYSFALVRPTSR